jgi:hypothetical protein
MGDAMEEDESYVDDGHKTKAELDKQRTTTNAEIEKDMAERVKKRLAFIERQTDLLLHFDPKVISCPSPSQPRASASIRVQGAGQKKQHVCYGQDGG